MGSKAFNRNRASFFCSFPHFFIYFQAAATAAFSFHLSVSVLLSSSSSFLYSTKFFACFQYYTVTDFNYYECLVAIKKSSQNDSEREPKGKQERKRDRDIENEKCNVVSIRISWCIWCYRFHMNGKTKQRIDVEFKIKKNNKNEIRSETHALIVSFIDRTSLRTRTIHSPEIVSCVRLNNGKKNIHRDSKQSDN